MIRLPIGCRCNSAVMKSRRLARRPRHGSARQRRTEARQRIRRLSAEKKPIDADEAAFFQPSEVQSTGIGHGRRSADRLSTPLRARSSSTPRTGTTPTRSKPTRTTKKSDKDDDTQGPKRRCSTPPISSMARPAPSRPITFLYNGGPGSSTVWLHMGAFGPVRVLTARRSAHAARALFDRQQRPEPARRQRPRVHRRARHRLQPDRRQGQGKGLLRRRPGRRRLRPLHHPVPVQVRPLELAQIPVRRKLRHDARRRPGARAAEGATSTSTA